MISRSTPLDSEPVECDGAFWVSSLDAALTLAGNRSLASTPSQHSDSLYQQVTAWIIGGGSIYAEALSRKDLPAFGRVEIIERTLLDSLEDTEITGDTYAPELTTEKLSRTNKPVHLGDKRKRVPTRPTRQETPHEILIPNPNPHLKN